MPVSDKLTYSVVDNTLTIEAIRTNSIEGDISLKGGLSVSESFSVQQQSTFEKAVTIHNDLVVSGEVRATVLHADTLITKTVIEHKEPVSWSVDQGGIEGKGLVWKRDKKNVDFFIYKSDPNRIYTNLSIDLYRGANYSIDGTPVFTADSLGPSILTSSLRKVGRLRELTVDGDVILGEHIFFDAKSTRLGIGTDHANAAFSLVDNGVEIVIGNIDDDIGNIGTYTSHDLGLITDNTTRMKITRGGRVIFGDPKAVNADVTINGKLFVKELVVDNRVERSSPLAFKADAGGNNYGKGIIFTGHGTTKQFILSSGPDQFLSTEHLNVQSGRGYFLGGEPVLISDTLGSCITKSSLTEVGTLTSLNVTGDVNLNNTLFVKDGVFTIGDAEINTKKGLSLIGSRFELKADGQSITISGDNIVLGSKDSPTVNAIINGKLAVGMQTVGPNAQLEVAGNIRFTNKLFAIGSAPPFDGTYRKGDIVWNDNPKETGYIGWVCVRDGNPGIWRGFGQIGIE